MIQEQDIHSNVQNLNDFPKKLIRAVSGASRLLAWDHFRWFVDLLIDILPVSFQVGAILWCLNVFFCCCCCCFVQNYLQTEWNHLLLACSRNHSTFPSTIVRLCESSTRERAWRGSKTTLSAFHKFPRGSQLVCALDDNVRKNKVCWKKKNNSSPSVFAFTKHPAVPIYLSGW